MNNLVEQREKTATSFFYFNITQTTKVLLYKMKNLDGKRWRIEGKEEDGQFTLVDLHHEENKTSVYIESDGLKFITVNGYKYEVKDKVPDGAVVTFFGPVNALLTQSLMPRMTYVPNTLQGMYVDMDEFVPISEYMTIREERHAGNPNPQDKHGWRVNMKFNNELVPFLPPYYGEMRAKKDEQKKVGKFARK